MKFYSEFINFHSRKCIRNGPKTWTQILLMDIIWVDSATMLREIFLWTLITLLWRHNGGECVSNHQPHDCLLSRLFGRWSKKTSKLRVAGLCAGNSPETGEFPAQMASNAENVSIWWRHHEPVSTTTTSVVLDAAWRRMFSCFLYVENVIHAIPKTLYVNTNQFRLC